MISTRDLQFSIHVFSLCWEEFKLLYNCAISIERGDINIKLFSDVQQ